MNRKSDISADAAELRRHAENWLRKRRKNQTSKAGAAKSAADTRRLLHELQVHQVELELQNAELQKARNELEVALENFTDLYDFAPVGYFSIDESGVILEANLTGAALLGVERSRLVNRRLSHFVVPESQPIFLAFLKGVFAGTGKQVCEVALLKEGAAAFWAGFRASSAISLKGARKWCRLTFADITARKQAEEAQRRVEVLAVANRELQREIVRRQAVEEALRKSEQHYVQLFGRSREMHEQLRRLSRQLLVAQEEERKRISRELHDVIAQTLTGINIRLATLKKEATVTTDGLERKIALTQELVQQSVAIVHRFARELRPPLLDDLGLIPALHAFMKQFRADTGIQVSLTTHAAVEEVDGDKRIVLFRVAQEALTNVARHAQATRAQVKIQKLDGAICMRIEDNGNGFQAEQMLHARKGKRLGLLGMRERLEMVGGSLTVTSAPGTGTTVLAQVPRIAPPSGGKAALIASARTKH